MPKCWRWRWRPLPPSDLKDVEIRTGDVALFTALIDALDLYPVWRRRLIKDFNRKVSLTEDIERLTLATAPGRNEYEGVLAALAGSDRKAALALVTDLMSIAGTTNVGGRTVAEIADRFLEQSTLKGGALPRDALGIIKRFLAIAGDPDESVAQLRALAADAKLDLAAAIDQFESRVGFMAARGIDTQTTRGSRPRSAAASITTPASNSNCTHKGNGVEPLVAGGRYDGLMTQLGSATPIPAVGFSVWIEALTQLGRQRRERRMTAPFVLAVPSKGRLQENAEAFFARAGLSLAKPRGARDYRGTIAGLDNVEIAYLSASEIAVAARARHGASRRHRRRSGARKHRRCRQARAADRRPRLRQRQCRGRGAAGLDRRPHHGRSRRRHDRLSRPA